MDTSIAIAIVALISGSIVVFLVWLKEIVWDFLKGRKTAKRARLFILLAKRYC